MPIHPLPNHPQMIHLADWKVLGEKLFGADKYTWTFQCPSCKKPSTVRDHANAWGGGIQSEYVGQKCPHCLRPVRPKPEYGPEECYRVLLPPEKTPNPEEFPSGMFVYVMPFFLPETPGEAAVREIVETVGIPDSPAPALQSVAEAPKPPKPKGLPSGYGFKF